MPTPRRARPAEQFPRPFEIEPKSEYVERCLAIKAGYTAAGARIAAEREWGLARDRALVCITAHGDQFLMFGELERS